MIYNYIKFLQDYNIEYDNNEAWHRGFITVPCPFCHSSNRYGGVNYLKNYYKCWKCGYKKIDEYVETATGKSWYKIKKEYLLDDYKPFKEPTVPAEKVTLPKGDNGLNKQAREYLLRRSFDPDELTEKYHIYSTNHLGKYKFRIIIPIYFKGQLISFTSRDYTNKANPRYLSCEKSGEVINHKNILYGYDQANSDFCFVVEGPIDKWKLGENAVATFGTAFNNQQTMLLLKFKKIITIFDNEQEAQKLANTLAETLSYAGREVKNIILKDTDPGGLTYNEVQYFLKKIKNV